MQTTLTLDDALLTQASAVAGIEQPGPLIHFALRALISQAPKKSAPADKARVPFVIRGPFAESNPDVCRNRNACELLEELDQEAWTELHARTARGETL